VGFAIKSVCIIDLIYSMLSIYFLLPQRISVNHKWKVTPATLLPGNERQVIILIRIS
jgi:hypothetical protein